MDTFDDEPSTGGGYERVISRPLGVGQIERRIVIRFRGRPPERVSVILEEVRGGKTGAIMRYDDAYGRFHRRVPGWPEPSREIAVFLDEVPVRRRAAYAIREIEARYTAWEADLFHQEGGEPE